MPGPLKRLLRWLGARARPSGPVSPTGPGDAACRRAVAYAFRLDLTLAEFHQALEIRGPWRWTERDSAWYGDYLSAAIRPGEAMLRLYEAEGGFVINLYFRSAADDAEDTWNSLHDSLRRDFLPAIGARAVAPTEPYDPPLTWAGP